MSICRTRALVWALVGMLVSLCSLVGAAQTVELNWYGPPGILMAEIAQEIGEDYAEVNPSVKVTVTGIGQSTEARPDVFITQVLGGVIPDIVFVQSADLGWWVTQGFFQPLDELAERAGFSSDEFIPGVWQQMQIDGRVYALPHVVEPFGLVWSPAALESSGLDPSEAPPTWDAMVEMARKILRVEGDVTTRWGAQFSVGGWNTTASVALALGAQLGLPMADDEGVYLDHPGWVDVIEAIEEIDSMQGGPSAWGTYTSTHVGRQFGAFAQGWSAGSLGFGHIGPWVTGQVYSLNPETRLGVGRLPVFGNGESLVIAKGWNLAIPAGAPHADEAMAFLRYLMSREPMEKWYRYQSSLPAQLDVLRYLSQDVLHELSMPDERMAFSLLAMQVDQAIPPASPVAQRVIGELQTVIQRTRGGAANPVAILAEADNRLETQLAELQAK